MARIGIFSDVHANLDALRAVLDALDSEGCTQLVCCGDVVGYGASPAECVELIRSRSIPCVMGNHDEYATLLMDPRIERLRDDVRASILWTQSSLAMTDLRWLADLPRRLDFDGFSVVHGAFGPKPYLYLTRAKNAAINFEHQDVPLAFSGHTHVPQLSRKVTTEGPPSVQYLRNGLLPEVGRAMVNPGAVGQPRDHDPRASCLVLDLPENTVRLVRVPYDVEATKRLILDAELPTAFAERLAQGR